MGIVTKKIATALLLALVLASLSYPFILQAKQLNVQHRMKEQLEGNMLHSLVMPKDDLHWAKPGKEILFGGKMFDIKTISYNENGTVYITGLFDHEESFLFLQMKKNRQEENSRNNQRLIQLFQLIQSLPDKQPEQLHLQRVLVAHYPFDDDLLPSPFKAILTPPPQC